MQPRDHPTPPVDFFMGFPMSELMLKGIRRSLESGIDLSYDMRKFLHESLVRWDMGLPLERAFKVDRLGGIEARDRIIREHAQEIPGATDYAKAKRLSDEARNIEKGRATKFPWLRDARDCYRLPETTRQFQNIISEK